MFLVLWGMLMITYLDENSSFLGRIPGEFDPLERALDDGAWELLPRFFLDLAKHGGNGGRIATAEHDGVRIQESLVQIVHELSDTGVAGEFTAKLRKVHLRVSKSKRQRVNREQKSHLF